MKLQLHNRILSIEDIPYTNSDDLLAHFHLSRKTRYLYYQQKAIERNGRFLTQAAPLSLKDRLMIHLQMEQDATAPWAQPLDVLYEDAVLLVVQKPSGLLVHSDGQNSTHTLCNIVKHHYLQESCDSCVRPLHRLDVETSGALLFCKEPFFQPLLDHQLENKEIYREYDAIVKGKITQKHFSIQRPIGRDRHNAKKMRISDNGKPARTDVTRMAVYENYSWVRCRLFTGRTHQIRVHMAAIGHPLLSDPLYGKIDHRMSRLALHASHMVIPHPLTQQPLDISCALPADMKQLLSK